MERPDFLKKYNFDWELFDVIVGGKSSLDAQSYLSPMENIDEVKDFLQSYGYDQADPVLKAELFGIFQEAIQFIRRYFLKEGNPEGLDFSIPNSLFTITDINELFLMAAGGVPSKSFEDCLWAALVLKVMHTIVHADKDLRTNYFSLIQQQIFDRFYRHLNRDSAGKLFLQSSRENESIPLIDFQTKSKKSRDSIIIKLLHKAENVAEELFDRIGVRFVTHNKLDILRVIRFLHNNNIILGQNIKPSRSINSLLDLENVRSKYKTILRNCIRTTMTEEEFVQAMEHELSVGPHKDSKREDSNQHSSPEYRSIQFTCRQMIQYKNPFMKDFAAVRHLAKEADPNNELVKKVLALDPSNLARDIRFFYPFEVQILDAETHKKNTEGEASHQDYKKAQLKTAMNRLFKALIEYKGMETPRT